MPPAAALQQTARNDDDDEFDAEADAPAPRRTPKPKPAAAPAPAPAAADDDDDDAAAASTPNDARDEMRRQLKALRQKVRRRDEEIAELTARLADVTVGDCARKVDERGHYEVAHHLCEVTKANGHAYFSQRRRRDDVMKLFGIRTWSLLVHVADLVEWYFSDEGPRSRAESGYQYHLYWSTSDVRKFQGQDREQIMSDFQQFLVTAAYLRCCVDRAVLADWFAPGGEDGMWGQRIDDALARWVPRLGVVGLYLSNLPTDKEFIRSTLPEVFHDLNYSDVGVLFDGRDIKAEVPRSFDLHQNMFSSKINVRSRCP